MNTKNVGFLMAVLVLILLFFTFSSTLVNPPDDPFAPTGLFLELDGTSIMAGTLDMGGNSIINGTIDVTTQLALSDTEIWIGDATDTAVGRVISGQLNISNTGVGALVTEAITTETWCDGTPCVWTFDVGANDPSISLTSGDYAINNAELTVGSAVADHEWDGVGPTSDATFGDADEGQITLGTFTFGQANDILSGTTLDDIVIFANDAVAPPENIGYVFFDAAQVPRFVIATAGVGRATYNPRSMVIGPAATIGNMDENILCATNFSDIDCDTPGTGADLGIMDDVEVNGDIFLDGTLVLNGDLIDASAAGVTVGLAAGFPSPSSTDSVLFWAGNSAQGAPSGLTAIEIEDNAQAVISFTVPDANASGLYWNAGGAVNDASILYYGPGDSPADTLEYRTNSVNRLRHSAGAFAFQEATTISTTTGALTFDPAAALILNAGLNFIGDATNALMTRGLTINQSGNDDQIFVLRSTDVVTVLTTAPSPDVNTNDYYTVQKVSATLGGATILVLAEDAAIASVYNLTTWGGTADTTKSTAGAGLITFRATEHNGANAIANVTADGNIVAIRARVAGAYSTRWILDEDGDTWQNGGITVTGDINPEADGTRDLGIQTTGQWANLWSDLVNGADFAYQNDWRMLESEKYVGYPEGIAFANTHFTDGVVTDVMPSDARPVFVVTDDFVEFQGVRFTAQEWNALNDLVKGTGN